MISMIKKKEIIKQKFKSMLINIEDSLEKDVILQKDMEGFTPGAYWRLNRCSAHNERRCHVH